MEGGCCTETHTHLPCVLHMGDGQESNLACYTETIQSCVVPEQLSSGLWILLCCTETTQSCVVPEQLSSGLCALLCYRDMCPDDTRCITRHDTRRSHVTPTPSLDCVNDDTRRVTTNDAHCDSTVSLRHHQTHHPSTPHRPNTAPSHQQQGGVGEMRGATSE
jgi:hypothetical protein